MASAASLRECLDALNEAREEGRRQTLTEILVDRKVLTPNQVEVVLEAARKQQSTTTRVLGGFRLVEKIAEGGTGVIYRAHQLALDRPVAVKVLSRRLAADAEFVRRMSKEAKAVARLDHPNIVRAIDFGEADGNCFFAMEFVEGESLADVLERRGKLGETEALGIAIQIARGMRCAWDSGIVHRDMKPGNILITRDGVAKIADLGLARESGAQGMTGIAQAGAIIGTPDYIAPEQAEGELAKAVALYEDALALGDDPALRERVRALEAGLRFAELIAEGERLRRAREWDRAIERFSEARGVAPAGDRKRIENRIRSARREKKYEECMRSARKALQEKAWRAGIRQVGLALKEKPGDKGAFWTMYVLVDCAAADVWGEVEESNEANNAFGPVEVNWGGITGIEVLAPNGDQLPVGGEAWIAGTTQEIRWSTYGGTAGVDVTIDYQVDGGRGTRSRRSRRRTTASTSGSCRPRTPTPASSA